MRISSRVAPIIERISNPLTAVIAVVGITTTTLALLVYAYLGIYSRYYADDYCLSGMLFQRGFWQAQIDSYLTWSNRYAGMFLVALSELVGGRYSIRVWSALAILLGVVCLAWMFRQVDRALKLSLSKIGALFAAELALFFTILTTPQLYQVLYWRIGLITYTLPLVILVFLAGLILRSSMHDPARGIPWKGVAVCCLLAIFAGGLSETSLALQTSLVILAILAVLIAVKTNSRAKARSWLALIASSTLLGSLIAWGFVIAAPGNVNRLALMPEPPGVLALGIMVGKHAALFFYSNLAENAFRALLATLIPMLMAYLYYSKPCSANPHLPRWSPTSVILAILVSPLLAFVLIAAVVAPAAYAQSSYPDGRVLVEAAFILVSLFMTEGFLFGVAFSQLHHYSGQATPGALRLGVALLLLALLLYPLYDAVKTSVQIGEFRISAQAWDARDAEIRAARLAGSTEVQVKAYNTPGDLASLSVDPQNWVNGCAAWFYDLRSITAVDP